MSQGRQPSGVPAGGQFTPNSRAESDAALERTEAYPLDSPAAGVAAFRGQRVGVWVDDSYIAPDGSYATVHEDHDPTGHWFVDGERADGRLIDLCLDSRETAQAFAERELTKSPDAPEECWRCDYRVTATYVDRPGAHPRCAACGEHR